MRTIKNIKIMRIGMLMCLSGSLVSCDQTPMVAKVDGKGIPAQIIIDQAEQLGLPRTPRVIDGLVENQIDLRVAEALVNELNLFDDPDFRRDFSKLALATVRKKFEINQHEEINISDSEIEAAYQSRIAQFTHPEKVRVALIAFPEGENGQPNFMATDSYLRLMSAEDNQREAMFAALASQHSTHRPSRYRGGDIGFLQRDFHSQWPNAVVNAAFSQREAGDISSVIITADGNYLLRLIHREPAHTEQLTTVAAQIRQQLTLEKQRQLKQDAQDQLRKIISHQRYDKVIAGLVEVNENDVAANGPVGPALQ